MGVTTFPEGAKWRVEAKEQSEWFAVEVENDLIVVTVEANDTEEERHAQLCVSAVNGEFDSRNIYVSQEAGVVSEMLGSSVAQAYEFDSRGGAKTFTVDGSYVWSVECDADWLTVEQNGHRITISASEYTGDVEREAVVTIAAGDFVKTIEVVQHTPAQNRYLNLVGKWEIVASQWYYTTNGSLNELSFSVSTTDHCLLFDIEEGEYGKTLVMKNFLYPGTSLIVQYDSQSGGFVIPFGWTVLSYDVFLYITGISGRQFFFASYEVPVTPMEEGRLSLDMPTISGCDHIGFGLWTYGSNGGKVAFGYSSHPTLFPMDGITLMKR